MLGQGFREVRGLGGVTMGAGGCTAFSRCDREEPALEVDAHLEDPPGKFDPRGALSAEHLRFGAISRG